MLRRNGVMFRTCLLTTLVFALACGGLKSANITSMCSVSLAEATCNFTNTGDGEGISCVKVKLKSEKTGAWLESEPVCSGTVAAGTSSGAKSFNFVGDIHSHCPRGVQESCTMEIENIDR